MALNRKERNLRDRMLFAFDLHFWGAGRMAWKNLVQVAEEMETDSDREQELNDGQGR